MLKNGLINFTARFVLFALYPFLSYRVQYWRMRILGFAFTSRNRKAFKYLGDGVFLSGDLVLHRPDLISIDNGTNIGRRCSLTVWLGAGTSIPTLEIGRNVSIGEGAHITAANQIRLGNHVLLGKQVTISDNNHGDGTRAQTDIPPNQRPLVSKGPIVIEDNVWIGDKATILGGVTIGRGAVVAANSVVTQDVPAAAVVAGVPARPIRRK